MAGEKTVTTERRNNQGLGGSTRRGLSSALLRKGRGKGTECKRVKRPNRDLKGELKFGKKQGEKIQENHLEKHGLPATSGKRKGEHGKSGSVEAGRSFSWDYLTKKLNRFLLRFRQGQLRG